MLNEPLENSYFNWLCAKVMRVENPTPSLTYWTLLKKMHETEFVWLVMGDDNRAEDGLELRDEFRIEAGVTDAPEWRGLGCSLLEMLIAFSRRAEFMTMTPAVNWFWKFVENLDLLKFNDASVNNSGIVIEQALYDVVWRQYEYNGQGGLFPLRRPQHEQKEVEIWYQFCEYLVDREIF